MKKVYTKPVMESEEFVSNEYVAACWTVDCLECGAYDEVYDTKYNEYLNASTKMEGYDVYTYDGTINGVDPCRSVTETSTPGWVNGFWATVVWTVLKIWFGAQDEEHEKKYHTIQFSNGYKHTNHPNASV